MSCRFLALPTQLSAANAQELVQVVLGPHPANPADLRRPPAALVRCPQSVRSSPHTAENRSRSRGFPVVALHRGLADDRRDGRPGGLVTVRLQVPGGVQSDLRAGTTAAEHTQREIKDATTDYVWIGDRVARYPKFPEFPEPALS